MLHGRFFNQAKRSERNLHNNIYRAGGRMCEKENVTSGRNYVQRIWKTVQKTKKHQDVFQDIPACFLTDTGIFRFRSAALTLAVCGWLTEWRRKDNAPHVKDKKGTSTYAGRKYFTGFALHALHRKRIPGRWHAGILNGKGCRKTSWKVFTANREGGEGLNKGAFSIIILKKKQRTPISLISES